MAPEAPGGVVASVEPGSAAQRAGIVPGDVVLSVDGASVGDVIDWQWATAEDAFDVTVDRRGRFVTLRVERPTGESVGVEFAEPLFDGIRECDNACSFCFVRQLPPGMRPALYVRDDDYRLSFLSGNFVSLTNLTEADVERIIAQRLSPLHVSVHAVDPQVRRGLVCSTVDDRALEWLDTLSAAGIEMHVQIVMVPGVNDGDVLRQTLGWLADRAGVESVGVVPLGFTSHQHVFAESFDDPAAAGVVLDSLRPWRERMVRERGVRWVHGADELYLAASRALPSAAEYDGFPQYENGIGMTRAFTDEWHAAIGQAATPEGEACFEPVLVTGELFAPALEVLALRAGPLLGAPPRVLPVANRFFGGNVSVTGLLTGRDIADAVAADAAGASSDGSAHGRGAVYLVPDVVLNADGVTLDDMTEADVAVRCGQYLRVVPSDAAGLLAAVLELSSYRSG